MSNLFKGLKTCGSEGSVKEGRSFDNDHALDPLDAVDEDFDYINDGDVFDEDGFNRLKEENLDTPEYDNYLLELFKSTHREE